MTSIFTLIKWTTINYEQSGSNIIATIHKSNLVVFGKAILRQPKINENGKHFVFFIYSFLCVNGVNSVYCVYNSIA